MMFDEQNLKNLFGDIQKNLESMQEKTKENIFTAKSGGGLVSVSMNGAGEVIDLNIDESLLEDRESLQILLISAINEVSKSVEENKKNTALGMLGGLGGFDFKKFGI